MSYSFVNRPAVKLDIVEATDYYKDISPSLAKQFLSRVREAKAHIARTPFGFQIKIQKGKNAAAKAIPLSHSLPD
jgi:hypothetical protein